MAPQTVLRSTWWGDTLLDCVAASGDEPSLRKFGPLLIVAARVDTAAALSALGGTDFFFARVVAISGLLHAFMIVAAYLTPESALNPADLLFHKSRIGIFLLKEKEKAAKPLALKGEPRAKHKGPEGKVGKPEAVEKKAAPSKYAGHVDSKKREHDRDVARRSGLLAILQGATGNQAVANVFSGGGLGAGINIAMGGVEGTKLGDARGAGGMGTRGFGSGGGGNSLEIGGLSTHGGGDGDGGYGDVRLDATRGKKKVRIVPGHEISTPGLSKEEIGRVIRRALARFKYCYEKELNAAPNLSGKVAIGFTIGPTGEVVDVSTRESTIDSSNVESCVNKVMRSLKFPKPKGGGVVLVSYPFIFERIQ